MSRPLAECVAKDALDPTVLAVREEPLGSNRGASVEKYLACVHTEPGNPWCAAFARYRYEQAAKETKIALPAGMPDSAYTPDWANWGKEKGTWVDASAGVAGKFVPRPGDLALFYFADMRRIAHIGIVAEPWIESGKCIGIITVEGNTGPDGGHAVMRNGYGVFRKSRRWGQLGTRGGIVKIDA